MPTPSGLTLPHNLTGPLIGSYPNKLRMSQVTIRRPFGELDLCEQVGYRTGYGRRQQALGIL
jgi:hypothetical protein